MRFKASPLLAALFLISSYATVHATGHPYPPGGGACLDTLDIPGVQNGGACRPPAISGTDTSYVYGVKGIITAIKNNGTSRTFYMQARRTNQQYTGMDCFTGNGLPNPNIAVGDSVSVSGKVEEGFVKTGVAESGETEISGFDGSNTTLDMVCNILSSGNSLPKVKQLTIADIRFPGNGNDGITQASQALGEPWESCVVKLNGPFVIAKRAFSGGGAEATYPGIETRSPNGGGMLVYKQGSPADSFYIDETSFVTITPLPVGTVIDSVFGVLQQGGRAGSVGISSWRVAARGAGSNLQTDDIYYATPPELSSAFPVADDSVRVVFDRDVTEASVTVPAHYSLVTSERSVDYVHMVGDNAVVCHIVGASPDGTLDSLTAVGMTGKVNGLTQNTPKGKAFYNGVLSIPTIQAPMPESLSVCVDRSKFAGPGLTDGKQLTFRGVATGLFFGREYYVQDAAGGPRSGVKVFQPSSPLTIGHQYLISAHITEFFNETEVNSVDFVQDEGAHSLPPVFNGSQASLADFSCDASQSVTNGEDYEGCLVHFTNYLRTSSDAAIGPGGFFHCVNPIGLADTIEVDAINATGYDPDPDQYIDVTGILSFRFSAGDVFPRNDADLTLIGPAGVDPGSAGRVSFSVYPNPARTAQMRFILPRRDQVDLAVFDVLGRRVATVAHGSLPEGTYTRSWNGVTDKGTKAGAGMYFYRLRVGTEIFNVRGVRLN